MNRKTDFPSFVLDQFIGDAHSKATAEYFKVRDAAVMELTVESRALTKYRLKLRALDIIKRDVGATLDKTTVQILARQCPRAFEYEVIYATQLLTYIERLEKLMQANKVA